MKRKIQFCHRFLESNSILKEGFPFSLPQFSVLVTERLWDEATGEKKMKHSPTYSIINRNLTEISIILTIIDISAKFLLIIN